MLSDKWRSRDLATELNVIWRRESARKGLNSTSGAQFAALTLVKPIVWFVRAVVNWSSRSVAKSACVYKADTFCTRIFYAGPKGVRLRESFLCRSSVKTGLVWNIICVVCRCRYSREAPFIALNVDIRNHHSLVDSLEQFVKGDLLEGANAYHCEKCDKKVPYCCIPANSLF